METARTFTVRLADLLARERAALGEFLVALARFDELRLWAELGYASLFDFLHRELGLSKASAFFRKRAAELIQRFPDLIEPLRDGRLCLTSVVELAKVLTEENRDEVLPRFFHLSKREAKAVSAAIRPDVAPPHRELVTTVRVLVDAPAPASPSPGEPRDEAGGAPVPPDASVSLRVVRPDEPARANSEAPRTMSPPGTPPVSAEPLTSDLNRLHLTVSRAFLRKLEAARAALSHSHPGASAQELLEAGLDLLLARDAKRKGLTDEPRREPPPSENPEYVPAHVRRAVWKRDGGRCTWPLAGGGVCGSTHRVELDHVVPRGKGGPSTVENIRLLCDVHNQEAARCVYGDPWMDRYTRGRRVRSSFGAERPVHG